MVSDHLSELINYGGQMLPRGTVYNTLRETAIAQGHSKRDAAVLADRWMQGHDLRRGNPDEAAPLGAAAIASTFTSNLALTTDPAFEHGDAETRAALITARDTGVVATPATVPAPPMTPARNPLTPTQEAIYRAALAADDAFQAALVRAYGKRAGDMRYARKLPAHIEKLRDEMQHAQEDWFREMRRMRRSNPPEPGDAPATSPALATAMGGGQPLPTPPTGAGRGTSTSTSTDVRSPTSTDVRSPTRTATSTEAYTAGNVTVTGGAGAGANTRVIIRRNPRRDDTPYAKYNYIANPESGAAALAEKWGGNTDHRETEYTDELHVHEYLTELGDLVEIQVETESGYAATLKFAGDKLKLASSEDGQQLYIQGRCKIDLHALHMGGPKWAREHLLVGRITALVYRTKKAQDGGRVTDYIHDSGTDLVDGKPKKVTDIFPMLTWDRRNHELGIVGGLMNVDTDGDTSVGLVR